MEVRPVLGEPNQRVAELLINTASGLFFGGSLAVTTSIRSTKASPTALHNKLCHLTLELWA